MEKIRDLWSIEHQDLREGLVAKYNGKYYKTFSKPMYRRCMYCAFENINCLPIPCAKIHCAPSANESFYWVEIEEPE